MDSVIATVSGYHGSERFNLIKLIARSGAIYVGAMNQSTTHLVCRKFEGKKYELARKLKIIVVNHRWVEDCVKQGIRVSERPYMKHCGAVIGPLLLEIPVAANEVRSVFGEASTSRSFSKNRVIDVESDDGGDDDWTQSSLLKKNLLPDERRNKDSTRIRRKGTKRCLRQDGSFTNEYVESDDDDDDDENWTQSSLLKENLLPDERRHKDSTSLRRKGTKRCLRQDSSFTNEYVESDDDDDDNWTQSSLLKENLLPDERRNKDSSRLRRKGTKRCSRQDISVTNEYVESDDGDDNWTQSSLLKENRLSDERRNKDRARLSRKGTKRVSRPDVSLADKYDLDEFPSFGLSRIESEDLTCPSSSHRVNKKKRDITRCETSKGSRRLMRKNADNAVKSSSDAEDDFQHTEINDKDVDIGEPSKYSKRQYQTRIPDYAKRRNLILEDSEQIEDLGTSDLRDPPCNNGVSASLSKNSLDKSTKVDDEPNEMEDTPASPTSIHLSCVICWTDFSSTRGVLPCGHRFCFSCIQNWADHMASMKKVSKCPLCKASFYSIQKMEEAVSSEQKIYSQTIPSDSFATDVYIIPHGEASAQTRLEYMPPPRPVCYQCSCREPEELLINCHSCEHRCVHSYCMDPPQTTWVCVQCKDLRMSSVAAGGAIQNPTVLEAFHKLSDTSSEPNEREDTPASPTPIHLSCVICWTDFSSTRGVPPCGHRFCFSCIQNWADHMASMKKVSKCPLCKASFYSIQKMEEAVSSEQKIYSQTIPNDCFATDVYIIPHGEASARTRLQYMPPPRPVCYQCSCREPEELLINCHSCEHRCVHPIAWILRKLHGYASNARIFV